MPTHEIVIIGAGPGGSSAAIYAAQAGFDVALIDAQTFPRDKTCGDGLTPRAMKELHHLGFDSLLPYRSQGLALHGFGVDLFCPWPTGSGSALRRTHLDHLLFTQADSLPHVHTYTGAPAHDPHYKDGRLESIGLKGQDTRIHGSFFLIADGVRSPMGKSLGRIWHREEVYGIAARAYCSTPRADEPWIHSHLELKDSYEGQTILQPGYGWIFPLGKKDGHANIGCGALSTEKRPARINTKKLLKTYIDNNPDWDFGKPQAITSALLPMGGAVSHVAGPNWMMIGDAAACVNPLNGEGIDYALETARLAVELLASKEPYHYSLLWPATLKEHYGDAFALARKAALLLTYPTILRYGGPIMLRSGLMPIAARLMGNLVFEEDKDLIAHLWRSAGKITRRFSTRPLWD